MKNLHALSRSLTEEQMLAARALISDYPHMQFRVREGRLIYSLSGRTWTPMSIVQTRSWVMRPTRASEADVMARMQP